MIRQSLCVALACCSALALVRGDAPSIEAGPDGIIFNVDSGSKIFLREGGGELEELVTTTAMKAMEAALIARLVAVEAAVKEADHSSRIEDAEKAISSLQAAVQDADHSTRIDAIDKTLAEAESRLDAVEVGVDAVEEAVEAADHSEKIEELAQGLALVEKEVSESGTVADFKQDFITNMGANPPAGAKGWKYLWNPDGKRLGESAGYKELVKIDSTSGTWKGKPEFTLATTTDTSKQRGDQSVRGQAAGWLNYGIDADGLKGNGHVGASDADGDHCFIAGWMVPEDHHYAITDSSITSTTPFQWHSASTGNTEATNGMTVSIYVDDVLQEECSAATSDGKTAHSEFNCVLGSVAKGATVYVAVCGGGNSAWDAFNVNYKIGNGLKAEINAASEHKTTAADVASMLGDTVADFRADFSAPGPSKGWKYKYNLKDLGDYGSFVELEANTDKYVAYTCGGKADGDQPTGACDRATQHLSIKKHGVHPGSKGMYAIVEYTWEGVENSDGIEVEVFVLPQQGAGVKQKAMVKVMDNQVGFQTAEESWSKPLANVAFDGSLGVLAQGPNENNGYDWTDFDFKISRGPVPLLTPRDGLNSADASLPLFGGGLRK
eukprot:gene5977-28444_t